MVASVDRGAKVPLARKFAKEVQMTGGSSGAANAAQGQIQADEMRMNPGTIGRWGKGERRRMLWALLPLTLVSILAFWVSR